MKKIALIAFSALVLSALLISVSVYRVEFRHFAAECYEIKLIDSQEKSSIVELVLFAINRLQAIALREESAFTEHPFKECLKDYQKEFSQNFGLQEFACAALGANCKKDRL